MYTGGGVDVLPAGFPFVSASSSVGGKSGSLGVFLPPAVGSDVSETRDDSEPPAFSLVDRWIWEVCQFDDSIHGQVLLKLTPTPSPLVSVAARGAEDQLTLYAFAISVRYASTNSGEGVAIVNFLATFNFVEMVSMLLKRVQDAGRTSKQDWQREDRCLRVQ